VVENLGVPEKVRNFFNSRQAINFSRGTLLYGDI
jgi:hypothetical protein